MTPRSRAAGLRPAAAPQRGAARGGEAPFWNARIRSPLVSEPGPHRILAAGRPRSAVLADVLFTSKNFYFRDILNFHYPLRKVLIDSYARGEWPLWNPYVYLGQPMLANPNYMAFYPSNLFHLFLPSTTPSSSTLSFIRSWPVLASTSSAKAQPSTDSLLRGSGRIRLLRHSAFFSESLQLCTLCGAPSVDRLGVSGGR